MNREVNMIEVINPSHDPYFNLALEEYLVKSWTGPKNLFVLWQNQPAVIIGRNQNAIEEVNLPYLEQEGIALVRRMSGGGAVYHDSGNLNYTLVLDDSQDFANFDKFTRPVIKALKKIGVKAENSGRNDITIKGLKFSGNAQFKYYSGTAEGNQKTQKYSLVGRHIHKPGDDKSK
jgi:lipoate-protein ligase A